MNVAVVPLHLGGLHPLEQLLVMVLAFGPFLVLLGVIVVRRRRGRDPASGQRDR